MISIVLMEPEHPGNIGAIARVMKNFDITKLVIINPQCDVFSNEAKNRAKHAQDVLSNARVLKKCPKFDYLIATTAKLGSDYNVLRSSLTPEKTAIKLSKIKNKKIGVLIGREGYGLFNHEIEKCDFTMNIPSSKKYPTLNISHSVAIICYEIHKLFGTPNKITPISYEEKRQIQKMYTQTFNKLKFQTKEKKETQKILWKKIIGKAMLTKREAYAVMGFLRKLIEKL